MPTKPGLFVKVIAPNHEASVLLNLAKSHSWYDFTVHTGTTTEAQFAGRVETGRPSFTDPLMGGVV